MKDSIAREMIFVERDGTRQISEEDWRRFNTCLREGEMQFQGENPCFDDYQRWTPERRGQEFRAAEQKNWGWVRTVLDLLEVCWIEVRDGQVVKASEYDCAGPGDATLFNEGERTGRVPFVFPSGGGSIVEG